VSGARLPLNRVEMHKMRRREFERDMVDTIKIVYRTEDFHEIYGIYERIAKYLVRRNLIEHPLYLPLPEITSTVTGYIATITAKLCRRISIGELMRMRPSQAVKHEVHLYPRGNVVRAFSNSFKKAEL